MTTPFKPFPEIFVDVREDGIARVCSTKGEDLLLVLEADKAVLDRLVECWNACRKFYGPANHIEATEDYVKRLEQLRKDAWARVQELEAEAIAEAAA
jgi:hypothetical protein